METALHINALNIVFHSGRRIIEKTRDIQLIKEDSSIEGTLSFITVFKTAQPRTLFSPQCHVINMLTKTQ
jgi:hypothetical protein